MTLTTPKLTTMEALSKLIKKYSKDGETLSWIAVILMDNEPLVRLIR